MRQYRGFKESHPDCLLFFRMGDFYEMFDEDAITVHREIGLTLTERTSGIPMAGVPFHAAEGYLQKLIARGFRVAVCDQVQDPAEAKGVVDRAVTRVLTPGTLVDESLLEDGVANSTALVTIDDAAGLATMASAEVSTGRFDVRRIATTNAVDEAARLAPSELLVSEAQAEHPMVTRMVEVTGCACTVRPNWTIQPDDGERLLAEHWNVKSLESWGLADQPEATAAAGGLLRFLQETLPGASHPLAHMQPPVLRHEDHVVQIDASTLRHLEIERTMRSGGTDGSLLDAMRCTVSPMGRRMLRSWLCWPLAARADIESRHDLVAALLADDAVRRDLIDAMDKVHDVARIAARASTGRMTPRDHGALGRTILQIPAMLERVESIPAAAAMSGALSQLQQGLSPLGDQIHRCCVDEPPAHMRDGGLFRDGIDDALDAARHIQRHGAEWLAEYQAALAEQTGIPSLKVGYNRVFGYYIEITHTHAGLVPPDFVRKQTLKNAERYITDRLKQYEDEALSAQRRAIEREQALFAEHVDSVRQATEQILTLSETIATLDVLCGFAQLAQDRRYIRPTMTDGIDLDIRDGRHPVLDARLGSDFVPNDCTISDEHVRTPLLLITGPNMAGKSTFIRQVALITLLAHAGCFVPASSATLGVTDRIFARIGASDELHAGMSTFMVEMTESANILHNATSRSLVILDEVGRGTSTLDGLSLAWAITEALVGIGCRTLFATHYHELTDLGERMEGVGNRHVAVQDWEDQVVFLHRIQRGATDRSYGVHVGRLAGLPPAVIDRAREVLDSLEVHHTTDEVPPAESTPAGQLGLFTQYLEHPIVESIRNLDLRNMSPMDAFDTMRRLQEELEGQS